MKKYTLEQFTEKYAGKKRISCGINYIDGTHDTYMNGTLNQILAYIKQSQKEVAFIGSR